MKTFINRLENYAEYDMDKVDRTDDMWLEVDENVAYAVIELNTKGYKVYSAKEGHGCEEVLMYGPAITFERGIEIPALPKHFFMEILTHENDEFQIKLIMKKMDDCWNFQKRKLKALNSLNKWAEKLPSYNEVF